MIFLWCNTATAESELPPCQGEDSMQWTNCYGSYNDRDITDYIKKNFPKMEELYPNSYYTRDYNGEFGSQPGLRNGHGISNLYLNDELYSTNEGKYFNDQRKGYSVYKNIMRSYKYVGEYKDGKLNGQGTYTWDNGNKFVGEFKDGTANGQGTMTWVYGDKYVGEYKDGKRNGQGTYTWDDGVKFVGEYKDNKRDGLGTMTWVNGDEEVAIFTDDELVKIISSTCPFSCEFGCIIGDCNGGLKVTDRTIGTYVYNNGDAYVGQWLNNKQDGKGVYTFSDRTTKEGIWSYGDLIYQCMEGNCINGKGLIKNNENGEVYFGDLKNYEANGEGVLAFSLDGDPVENRNKYSGEFKNNKYHGKGTLEVASGGKYISEFKDGRFHGKYTYVDKYGVTLIGEYEDGSKKDGLHTRIDPDGTELKILYEYGEIKEFLFENESKKKKWLEKLSKKNKIKENAELKCLDNTGHAIGLKFEENKNQIFVKIGSQKIDNQNVNFDTYLNYILRNNDRVIIAAGLKSFNKNGVTKSVIVRIKLDKYNGDLLLSVDVPDEKGIQYVKTLMGEDGFRNNESKANCRKKVLN